jgi:hypothetical protein
MFRRREQMQGRFAEVIKKFRDKGAVSADKAMSAQDLGLPPRFEEAMHRKLGQTGVIVEVNGKYYLSEEKLKEFKERVASL